VWASARRRDLVVEEFLFQFMYQHVCISCNGDAMFSV
jgi:hypothetical protein